MADIIQTFPKGTSNGGQEIQFSTVPLASADLLGHIIQYVGTTDQNYQNGYFYKCVEDITSGTYKWELCDVQDMEFMTSSDMDDVVTPLPAPTASAQRPVVYSLQEQVVGQWIDGRPLYQKSFTGTFPVTPTTGSKMTRVQFGELPKDSVVVDFRGHFHWANEDSSSSEYGNHGTAPMGFMHDAMRSDGGSPVIYRPESFAVWWTQYYTSTDRLFIEGDIRSWDNQTWVVTVQYYKPIS